MWLLEFNPHVAHFEEQPVKIPYPGDRGIPYVPDLLVTYRGKKSHEISELYEVKYRVDLREIWPDCKHRYRAAIRYARKRGWRFKIITEVEIRTDLLFNAKFLLPYLMQRLPDPLVWGDHLLTTLKILGPTDPETLLSACYEDKWTRAQAIPYLWQLIGRKVIGMDYSKRLNMKSEIWYNRG